MAIKDWIKNSAASFKEKQQAIALAKAEQQRVAEIERREVAQRLAEQVAYQSEIERRMVALRPLIDARWPVELFPRVPQEVLLKLQAENPGTKVSSNLREDDPGWWESRLKKWPNPPANDYDRRTREQAWWTNNAAVLVRTGADGNRGLWPKQEIMDLFWYGEKWAFRDYYAVTGIHHKTYFGHEFINYMLWEPETYEAAWERAINQPNRSKRPSTFSRAEWISHQASHINASNERIQQEIKAYWEKADAHRSQWSEWFFHNVEQAFRAQQKADQPLAPSSEL